MWQILKSRKYKIVTALLLLLIIVAWLMQYHRKPAVIIEAVPVKVSQVTRANVAIEARAIGTLVAPKDVEITPEIAGHVAKIFFTDGGVLAKQGMPLVQLDDAAYKAKLESAKANLIYSENDYKRKILLGKEGAISQQAIDQALADLKTKQAEVKQSQVNVDKMLLTAPFDGILGKFNVSVGDYVTVGQKIVSLTDILHLHVDYAVSEKYLPQLRLGQHVKIVTSTFPGKEFHGTVAFISPTINKEDRNIALYADVPNEQRILTAGLFVNVIQELGVEANVLIIPAAALVPTIDGQQVFKIVNNKAVVVPVKIGQRMQNSVEILSGLQLGDIVVIAGQQKLKEGSLVKM